MARMARMLEKLMPWSHVGVLDLVLHESFRTVEIAGEAWNFQSSSMWTCMQIIEAPKNGWYTQKSQPFVGPLIFHFWPFVAQFVGLVTPLIERIISDRQWNQSTTWEES